MIYLFDTSALLIHYRQEPGWEVVQALFEDPHAKIIIASVTIAEFSRRMNDLGASTEEIMATLAEYRHMFSEVVPIDEEVAHLAFVIGHTASERVPLADALIAAAASSRKATLVHRDKHMNGVPVLLVETLDLAK
jgi:predicted nucleic acid-binding protein